MKKNTHGGGVRESGTKHEPILRRNVPAHLRTMGVKNVDSFCVERGLQGAVTRKVLERIYTDPSDNFVDERFTRSKRMLFDLNNMMKMAKVHDNYGRFQDGARARLGIINRIV